MAGMNSHHRAPRKNARRLLTANSNPSASRNNVMQVSRKCRDQHLLLHRRDDLTVNSVSNSRRPKIHAGSLSKVRRAVKKDNPGPSVQASKSPGRIRSAVAGIATDNQAVSHGADAIAFAPWSSCIFRKSMSHLF